MNVNMNAAEATAPAPLWEQCVSAFPNLKWLSSVKQVSAQNGILSLEAPNEISKNLITGQFYDSILLTVRNIDESIEKIVVFAPKIEAEIAKAPELQKPAKLKPNYFCEKYKLENFIAETSNASALQSAKFIATMPRKNENFLIIKSAPGLGKTHLLHAIGNEAEKWAQKAVLWDSDRFFKEKRKGNLSMLYQADILLFDNLQNIFSSESAQKDILNIFKRLKMKGVTIVVSVNSKTKEHPIPELLDFLKMGIKCELKSPDLHTRTEILRQKAKEKNLPVEQLEECWKIIAIKVGENVCALEGVINRLAAEREFSKCQLTPQFVLSLYQEAHSGDVPSMQAIAASAAQAYNIPVDSLCGKSRIARVNKPRQIAIYLCKQTGHSLVEIGKFFNRDASTISNAIESVKSKITNENYYSFEFEINDILSGAKAF